MRRNRVVAGASAFLIGVAGICAASLAISDANTPDGVPPTTTLTASSPPSPSKPASPARDVRIAAVGDMNGFKTSARNSPSARNGAAITKLVKNNEIDAFLGIGDFQYDTAYCADYVKYWTPLWGGTKPKLYWVSAPNHDWQPGRNEDLDNFMNGQCPGAPAKAAINRERGFIGNGEPYSKDFGNWHFAFLSSAYWRYDSKQAEELTKWLDDDLAAARAAGKHLAVVHHEPYFASNTDEHERAADHKPWIDVMWKHRVRLTLSGSQHNYERSCPVNNDDQCVNDGMTAFQVSTGGIGLRPFTSSPSYIVKRFSDTHGFLRLTLRDNGSFDWKFVPTTGKSTDAGTRSAP
nr:metallophosphoesterase [Arthrobacter sp. ZGTC131]